MPKFKVDLVSTSADWEASITVNAESREQAERVAAMCMKNPFAWLPKQSNTGPLQPGDKARLKEVQPIVGIGKCYSEISIPAGEVVTIIEIDRDVNLAIVKLADLSRYVVRLDNLERV